MESGNPTFIRCCAGLFSVWLFLLPLQIDCLGATLEEVVKKISGFSPRQRKAALEEGARKEGEIIWYTSMSFTDYPKIVGAFEQSNPFVKVKANRLSQSTVFTKVDTEARAGHMMV